MILKVYAHSPSFGVVTKKAVSLAMNRHERDIDNLVASQKDNYNYNVSTTYSEFFTPDSYFTVSTRDGLIIELFKSLEAACLCASALDKAKKQ